jgi:type II secretory pathway component PulC
MRFSKLIFIVTATGALLFSGCSKQKSVNDSQLLKQPQALEATPDSEMKDVDSLLTQLQNENPFRPDHASTYIPKDIGRESNKLKGIIWDAKSPYALIGDKVVVEGDYVDNKKVIKINKDSILLDNNGQVETIVLERGP